MITRHQQAQHNIEASSDSKVAEPANKHKTSFLDLSAELRNQIYRLCLIARKPVHVAGNFGDFSMTGYRTFSCSSNGKRVNPFAPGLSGCCKQIRDESISILYGENAFVFRNAQPAQFFFNKSPHALKHIRSVTVSPGKCQTKTEVKRLLTTLKGAPRLRELTLGFDADLRIGQGRGMKHYDVERAAKVLGPSIRQLWRQRKDAGKIEVLEIIRWSMEDTRKYPLCPPAIREQAIQFGADVRARLERTLK